MSNIFSTCIVLLLVMPNMRLGVMYPPVAHSCFSSEKLDAQQAAVKNDEIFKLVNVGSWRASDHSIHSFRVYRNSEGTMVQVYSGTFGSPDKALAELHQDLNEQKAIMEHKEKKNSAGKVVGERAVKHVTDAESHETYTVLWTNGSDAYWVESSSLATALLFENRINSGISLTGEQNVTK